jgi:thiol:disulfide interchange protein
VVWTKLGSTAALDTALEDARRLRRPTVVIVWAAWASYAKSMMKVIEGDESIRRALSGATTLVLDATADEDDAKSIQRELRTALKIPENQMPWVAFVDATGSRRPDLDIDRWDKATFRDLLAARLATLGLRD